MNAPTRPPCRVGAEASSSAVHEALLRHGRAWETRYGFDLDRRRVLRRLVACRTEAMGTHLCVCDACGWIGQAFNSCRDRHCSQCSGRGTAEWLHKRQERMLPVPHFQVVFTLPAELRSLVFDNPARLYGLLFSVGTSVLQDLAAQRLSARLGITAVLHTWTSELHYHPHVHCLVTAGGLSLDSQRWEASRKEYLFPGRILGAMFRGRFLQGLIDAVEAGEVQLPGSDPVAARKSFRTLVRALSRRHARWVVHVEPPRGRPVEHATKYLARYVKRVAISNARIVEVTDDTVAFRSKRDIIRLEGVEFVRRFMLHVLPSGFRKVRHYGLYAPGAAGVRLETARELLPDDTGVGATEEGEEEEEERPSLETCPVCGEPQVRRMGFEPPPRPLSWPRGPP